MSFLKVQLNFTYMARNHNKSCLKSLYIIRWRPYNNNEETAKIKGLIVEEALGDIGKGKKTKKNNLTGKNLRQRSTC